jgi:hypothetical protein
MLIWSWHKISNTYINALNRSSKFEMKTIQMLLIPLLLCCNVNWAGIHGIPVVTIVMNCHQKKLL